MSGKAKKSSKRSSGGKSSNRDGGVAGAAMNGAADRMPVVLGNDQYEVAAIQTGMQEMDEWLVTAEKEITALQIQLTEDMSDKQMGVLAKRLQRVMRDVRYAAECMKYSEDHIEWIQDGSNSGAKPAASAATPAKPAAAKPASAKPTSPAQSISSSDEDSVDTPVVQKKKSKQHVPKLVAPKKSFTGKEDWILTERWIAVWYADYQDEYTDAQIGRRLMDVISGDAELAINATISAGQETYTGVMKCLQQFFGKRTAQQTAEKEAALSEHKRAGAKVGDFVREHIKRFAEAKAVGEQWSSATGGTKLLKAADLSVSQEAQMRATIATKQAMLGQPVGNPSYADVLEQLWGLADVYAVADSKKAQGKKKPGKGQEETALFTGGGEHANADGRKKWWQKKGKTGKDGKGKGKGAKGKGKGKWNGKGKRNQWNANNTWSSGGKWNDGGKGKGKWSDWGKGPKQEQWGDDKKKHGAGICRWDAEGKPCPYGDKCKFEHKQGGGATRGNKRGADPKGEQTGKRRRPAVATGADDDSD